ncbi:MAG: hypothetical protein H0W78_16485 [Planctomycetes bacterium]|nr:hypothetical protein [Planctomycetota bacterium]
MSDLASLITKAKSGQVDTLTALIEAMARDLRAFIATYATSPTMVDDAHTATWIQVRKELHACPPNSQAITWVRQRAMGVLRQQLEEERDSAIAARDGLRHLIAQDGSEGLEALVSPTNDGASLLNQRYAALDESAQVLISRRYSDGATLSELAGELGQHDGEIAKRLFTARAALHWRSTEADRRPPDDPHLAIAIDQCLAETLDANSRHNLGTTLMKDLGRAAAFTRQARIDLMLYAVFGAYTSEQARSLATTLVKIEHKRRNESSLLQVMAPPRVPVGSGTELRMANDRVADRQTGAPSSAGATAATRAAARPGGGPGRQGSSGPRRPGSSNDSLLHRERPRRRGNQKRLIIGGAIAAVVLIAVIALWSSSGGRPVPIDGERPSGVQVAAVLATGGGAQFTNGTAAKIGDHIAAGQGLDNPRGETSVELAGSARVVLGNATQVMSFDALPDRTGQVLLGKGTLTVLVSTKPGIEVRTAHGRVTFGIGRGTIACESDRTLVHAQGGSVTVVGADGSGTMQVSPEQRVEILAGAAPRLVLAASFVRGINLGGTTVTIDRRRWLSHREALSAGFSLRPGTSIAPQAMFSGSGLDFDRKTMLDTGLIASGGPVQFTQVLPNGSYTLTVWLANTTSLDVERMGMTINDQPIALAGALLKRDTWALLGPLPIRASNGRIEVSLAGQGTARVTGIALEAPGGDQLVLPSAVAITGPVDGASFYAGEQVTIRAEVIGKVKLVQFYSGAKLLGEADKEPYLATIPKVEPGEHRIIARALNFSGGSSESLPLTLSVVPSFGSGTILLERWTGIDGQKLNEGKDHPKTSQPPQMKTEPKEFASQIDWGDKYYCRIRGYVHPPITGEYVFWMTADDEGELLLSTSDDPAQAQRIAYNDHATGARDWNKEGSQKSKAIPLVAGQKYYIELRYKEHEGDDYGACGWKLPNGMMERPIPGAHLSPFKP